MARKGTHRHPAGQQKSSSNHAPNAALQAAMLDVVDNQLRDGTPPETRQTYDRLVAAGYPEPEVRRLIGCVVTSEIVEVLQRKEPYDEARYIAALRRLPAMPWETGVAPGSLPCGNTLMR